MSTEASEPTTYVDLYAVRTDCALLGLAESGGGTPAVYASGLASWEEFEQACDMGVTPGYITFDPAGRHILTSEGRERVEQLREAEVTASAAGALTVREASAAHADFAHQHLVPPDAPVMRKLFALMGGDTSVRLTPEEASSAAMHAAIQSGPVRQKLIDKLNGMAGDELQVL